MCELKDIVAAHRRARNRFHDILELERQYGTLNVEAGMRAQQVTDAQFIHDLHQLLHVGESDSGEQT